MILDFIAQTGDPTNTGEGTYTYSRGYVYIVLHGIINFDDFMNFFCKCTGGESAYGHPFKVLHVAR